MTSRHPMLRFPDEVEGRDGVYCEEAQEYGVGAFSWARDGYGNRYIMFRFPHRFPGAATSTVEVHAIPVEGDGQKWDWDGDEGSPTLSPSILIKSLVLPDEDRQFRDADYQEVFHGFIRAGMLEVL